MWTKRESFCWGYSRDDFCRWGFSEYNAGAKVLWHSLKSYDSYPILQYLYKHAILPEVIMTGSKFISIDVPQCKIRILDSINVLPMALEKLPDSFGLTEMAKGYEENKDNPFALKDEILKYCRSDVDSLRKGCLTFRNMFMDVTCKGELQEIDPFESCITIASACNLVFRRNFLDNESIGIIPANRYTSEHRQSIKALKGLKYVSERDEINILHSRNRGEKQIGSYKVDGYRETETGDHMYTFYEFHGYFWHGCQKCFSRSTTNPVTNSTMEDFHQGTLDKKQYQENFGYIYVYMWECDYEREIQSNGSMRSFVDSLCIVDPLEPRNAFYGGRT